MAKARDLCFKYFFVWNWNEAIKYFTLALQEEPKPDKNEERELREHLAYAYLNKRSEIDMKHSDIRAELLRNAKASQPESTPASLCVEILIRVDEFLSLEAKEDIKQKVRLLPRDKQDLFCAFRCFSLKGYSEAQRNALLSFKCYTEENYDDYKTENYFLVAPLIRMMVDKNLHLPYEKLADYDITFGLGIAKWIILDCIKNLRDQPLRHLALLQSLSRKTFLGQIFYFRRGWKVVSFKNSSGSIRQIADKLICEIRLLKQKGKALVIGDDTRKLFKDDDQLRSDLAAVSELQELYDVIFPVKNEEKHADEKKDTPSLSSDRFFVLTRVRPDGVEETINVCATIATDEGRKPYVW